MGGTNERITRTGDTARSGARWFVRWRRGAQPHRDDDGRRHGMGWRRERRDGGRFARHGAVAARSAHTATHFSMLARVLRSVVTKLVVCCGIARVVVMRCAIRMHVRCHSRAGLVRETRQLQGGGHPLQRQSQQQEASDEEAQAMHGLDFTG